MRFPISATASLLFFAAAIRADAVEGLKPGDTLSTCVAYDENSAYSFKPHCKETIERAGSKSEMVYNAQGLRDKDYSEHPKPGWKRILFIGSSRMAGPGLKEEDTPPRKLEKYLGGAKAKVEVINAGVEGYFPLLQSTRIESWIQAYHPTHVVLHVDFEPSVGVDMMYSPYFKKDEAGTIKVHVRILSWMKPIASLMGINLDDYPQRRRVVTWQSGMSRAYHSILCRLTSFSQEKLTLCASRKTLDAMTYIKKMTISSGARAILLFQPSTFTNDLILSPGFDAPAFNTFDRFTPILSMHTGPIVSMLKKKGTPIQLLIPLRGDDLTLPNDYHFNPTGADLFARGAALRLQNFLGEKASAKESSDQ